MVLNFSEKFTEKFFSEKFTELSQAKLKEGIFVRPQILEVFEDPEFENALNALEL